MSYNTINITLLYFYFNELLHGKYYVTLKIYTKF